MEHKMICYGVCGEDFFCIQHHGEKVKSTPNGLAHDPGYFSLYMVDAIPTDFTPSGIEEFLMSHDTQGSSVAGTREQILAELNDFISAHNAATPKEPRIKSREEVFKGEKSEWTVTDDDCCQLRRTDELCISNIFEMYQITSYPGKHCNPPRDEYFVIQHAIIDVLNYPEEDILDVLRAYGYKDMDDFVEQTSPCDPYAEAVYDEDGKLDRINSPNYIIDYGLIAEMLFEQECQATECNEPTEYDTRDDAVTHLAIVTRCDDLWGMLENVFSLNSEDNISMEFVLKDAMTKRYVGSHQSSLITNQIRLNALEEATLYAEHLTGTQIQSWVKLGRATINGNVLFVGDDAYLIERVLPSYQGSMVKVQWVNLGEGLNGDYNPNDPEDVNLLRFDVYHRNECGWEPLDNGSHCVLMDANTPAVVLKYAAQYIYERITDGATTLSLKQILEECSYIHAETICPKSDPVRTKKDLADYGYKHGNITPVSAKVATELLRNGSCHVYCVPKQDNPYKAYCITDLNDHVAKGGMLGVYDDDWCRFNLKQALKYGVNHYTAKN